ncbi:MAG TPA: GGDEF domain-containing protein [Solirubrobacteraceae bacterium]|jgi:diguanylate cyclase (GGDEF)-like protein|nr:GGDEF domain-containing protein [Solirubrobacteraceae bacterium]
MSSSSSQSLLQRTGPIGALSPLAQKGSALLHRMALRLVARRPPIAWSLALLFLFKASVCLAVIVFPISPSEPADLIGAAGALGVVGASGVWLLARRIPMVGFELLAASGSVVTSAMVAHASTHGGMMIAAFSYPWIAIYSAHFFPRRVVIAQACLISVGFGVGLLLGGLPDASIYWAVVTVTIWSICLVLGHLSESLRRQADTDPLTGLLNRNGFLTAAVREHAIAQRSGNRLTLAVLDLDGFKQINDLRGHLAGDRVLADLGRCWREQLRTGDILARHGGDEFVLLLPATSPEATTAVLDRLQVEDLPVSWSVGVSEWLVGESLGECIARADTHLYEVKNALRLQEARVLSV